MTPFIENITTLASLGVVIVDVLIALGIVVLFFAWVGNKKALKITQKISRSALPAVFFVSLAGVCGSLFYSEIAHFAPCELCWWQRMFLFPQVLILGIFLWYTSKKRALSSDIKLFSRKIAFTITLSLSGIGGLIALYHSYGTLVDSSVLPACAATGVSCAKIYFLQFGYVTIPTMSLTLFGLLFVIALTTKVTSPE